MKMKLSVVMMSYNQAEYINQAIASVLNQDLPFEWELLIGDDNSSDNTAAIVETWIEKYPDNIFFKRHNINIGLHQNYAYLMKLVKGEYFALLEADDFWVDPKKTNLQIEFMDRNRELAWCTTNGILVDSDGSQTREVKFNMPEKFDFDFFLNNFFNPLNNSSLIRKSSEPEIYPDFWFKVKQWDTVLYYLRSFNGDIGFLPVNGLAWRRHKNATSFSSDFVGVNRYKDWIVINDEMRKIVNQAKKKHFNNVHAYEFISLEYFKEGNYFKFVLNFFKMFFSEPLNKFFFYRNYFWKLRN